MKNKKIISFLILWSFFSNFAAIAQTDTPDNPSNLTIFDDKMLLDGYSQKFKAEPKDILLEMIKDDTLSPYKTAAAVRNFRERFAPEIFSREKVIVEKILLRRLDKTDSTFVQVEIMHTLCIMDRYRYFGSMVPILIQKMDHYNSAVNEIAYSALNNIIETGHSRAREARIIFNTLRKVLFLSRKRIANIKEPGLKLKQKLELLRWAIKILGTEELKKLPKEVISLL